MNFIYSHMNGNRCEALRLYQIMFPDWRQSIWTSILVLVWGTRPKVCEGVFDKPCICIYMFICCHMQHVYFYVLHNHGEYLVAWLVYGAGSRGLYFICCLLLFFNTLSPKHDIFIHLLLEVEHWLTDKTPWPLLANLILTRCLTIV